MTAQEANYFTCTLGEAALLKEQGRLSPSFGSVLELIEGQARTRPDAPALGFANPGDKSPEYGEPPALMTFSELDKLSRAAALEIKDVVLHNGIAPCEKTASSPPTVIGLLGSSSLDLVLSWLGLLRLGYISFFFAPQLQPHAIEHLCRDTGIKTIFADHAHRGQLSLVERRIDIVDIPNYYGAPVSPASAGTSETVGTRIKSPSSLVFLQHTSGTSSGLPKSISQTEWGAVGCLPVFSHPCPRATFTTTPLYHGGIADAFRAWTSGALIWFFPEGLMPVTGNNIQEALHFARQRSGETPVSYFSSVPYVLQMLVEGEYDAGVGLMKSMDLVGVGGAPLASSIGDELVSSGVNLLSRFGSAECGFLMSSHRTYAEDKDWQCLRIPGSLNTLAFELRDEGLSELVVMRDWPLVLKTNRDNRSYATADLFEQHPQIRNGWRYHGRADALIALANGKKFDPEPIENFLRSSCKLVRDVLVFGEGKDRPGVLLLVDARDMSHDAVFQAVWPVVQKYNLSAPTYARLSRSMVAVHAAAGDTKLLPKSSKGTVLRQQANKCFASLIEEVYSRSTDNNNGRQISEADLVSFISDIFEEVIGRPIQPDQDIYGQGVDSMACLNIVAELRAALLPTRTVMPRNIIYDSGTIDRLAKRLERIRTEDGSSCYEDKATPMDLMRQLSDKFSRFDIPSFVDPMEKKGMKRNVVVLTGATGALGAHILGQLIDNPKIDKVYCLTRSDSGFSVKQRIMAGLVKRQVGVETELEYLSYFGTKVVCLPSDLSASNLGLSDSEISVIIDESTHIIHSAWPVNFALGLRSFESQLEGLRNLLQVSSVSGARFFFISSTAAVSNTTSDPISETVSLDPREASPMGYSRSKWVAEQICARAHKQDIDAGSRTASERPRVNILRVGQLCGNKSGVWNSNEAYPLLLSTVKLTSCLPDLPGECLNWLPVDIAARSVLEIALSHDDSKHTGYESSEIPVYHVLNPHHSPSWQQMLDWVSQERGSIRFDVVSVSSWLERLEKAVAANPLLAGHPCQALVGLWKGRYHSAKGGSYDLEGATDQGCPPRPNYGMEQIRQASSSIRHLKPLNRDQVVRMWNWIQSTM
ncbi:hypothetical protein F5Y17DRAFT_358946 [Xylariaceae sp. FL0594]|nr:hypothetical protein F5Y17DRAFT_358946 [Xylariaceae sp. FL0594]